MKAKYVAPSQNRHLWYVWEIGNTADECFIICVCLSEAEAIRKYNASRN